MGISASSSGSKPFFIKRSSQYSLFLTIIILFFMLSLQALAQQGSIKLLAVNEGTGNLSGSIADLSLDMVPGTGRVFIDTMPSAKIDTQLSTRFAKNVACNYLDIDCSNLDFFYTIKADSIIVGGPSAGAASAILTISLLDNFRLDNSTVITGTVTSGNMIGMVGGLKEKIGAAAASGFKKVLIPYGSRNYTVEQQALEHADKLLNDSSLVSIDLQEYGASKEVEVIEVSTIDEALYYYAHRPLPRAEERIDVSEAYSSVMGGVAEELCNRSSFLAESLESAAADRGIDLSVESVSGNSSRQNISLFQRGALKAENLSLESAKLFAEGKYYSASSYCFGANNEYSFMLLKATDLSRYSEEERLIERRDNLLSDLSELHERLGTFTIKTITDLQAVVVTKDRLLEVEAIINDSLNNKSFNLDSNFSDDAFLRDLSYASERMLSAQLWARFLGQEGKEFSIGKEDLRGACLSKISEAEEQEQYLSYIYDNKIPSMTEEISLAREQYFKGNYELCLHEASLAKARTGVIMSSIGLEFAQYNDLLHRKLDAAGKIIMRQQKRGVFPIVGYSYYEYSQALEERDIALALLYSEYSLELSNVDMYFDVKKRSLSNGKSPIVLFLAGVAAGISICLFVMLALKSREAPVRPSERPFKTFIRRKRR